jgi:LPXTG-motif cell wall-anchored protein
VNRVFRTGRRRRRVALVAGVIAAVVVGMALPAWAHHPILSGETVCTNGDHVVSWRIENNQLTKQMTIDSATAAMVPGGTEYPVTGYTSPVDRGGATFATTVVPGNVTGTIKLTVTASWPGNFTSTKDTSVELVDTCVLPTTTTTTVPETTSTTVLGSTTIVTTTTTQPEPTTTLGGQGSTVPTVVNETTTTAAPGPGTLPRTGSSSGYAILFGFGCILGGALLLIRRRLNRAN